MSKSNKKSRRQAVLVLGMHRSGTSALSGMLSALGVRPPKSLMVPTKDNPKGYWESTVLMRFNDEVLASAGSKWNDWDRFNPQWLQSSVAETFAERLPGLLEKEYGDASMMLVKDPRICRILPLWTRVLKAIDVDIKIVLPLRHPHEVAQSLEARDGYGQSLSYLIWLRNVLEAEQASRGLSRSFVHYSQLVQDWRGQMNRISSELGITWPKWSGMVESEIEQYLNEGLRHAVAEDKPIVGNPQLSPWVSSAYQALQNLSDERGSSAVELQLDAIKHEFDQSCASLAAVVHETEQHSRAAVTVAKNKLDESVRTQASIAEKLLECDRQLEAQQIEMQAVIEGLKRQLDMTSAEARTEISELKSSLKQELATASASNASLQAQLEGLGRLLTGRVEALEAEKLSLVERHKFEILDLEEKIQSRDRKIVEIGRESETKLQNLADSMLQKTKQMQLEKSKLEDSLESRFSEIASMTTMLLDAEHRADTKRKLLLTRDQDIESLSEKISLGTKAIKGQHAQHLRNLAAVNAELAITRGALVEYRHRIIMLMGSRRWRLSSLIPGTKLSMSTMLEMPGNEASDLALLADSGLFDKLWYLARYPDVRKRGVDPVKHYLLHGAREGRDPGPCFSTRGYLGQYEDVASSGLNPLVHYLRYGLQEGRESKKNNRVT